MSSYAIILEMRKKKIGFFMHLIHFLLTVATILWVVVWVGHFLVVDSQNKAIDRQIEALLQAESVAKSL